MCERSLFRRLDSNFQELSKLHGEFYLVDKDIKLKLKLLDTKIITGVHIERNKNLSAHYYDITEEKEKIIFSKK